MTFAFAPDRRSRMRGKGMPEIYQRVRGFLFYADSDRWLSLLRIGLGLQITLYTLSLRHDWSYLFATNAHGPIRRVLTEAILSSQTRLTPRLGWLVNCGTYLGATEEMTLRFAWACLFITGCCLLVGLFCRSAAVLAWFLYLCSVKSGALLSYGVDNFTTIGLFYLMIAPLPDRLSVDSRIWASISIDPIRFGFHRRVLQLHLCLIYSFSGIAKCVGSDWWNGTSVWRALTRPPFDLLPPEFLVRFDYLLPVIGIFICVLETGYPVCIWIRPVRRVWLAGIVGMHLSIGLTMGLYLFSLIMIVLNLAAFAPNGAAATKKALLFRRRRDDSRSAERRTALEGSP